MRRRIDLTLGERLGLGFGALLAGLGLFTAAVLYWGSQSARAQRAYLEHIAPLHGRAQTLEGKLLYVAIGMRDFVLYPEAASRVELSGRIGALRAALARFEEVPKPPSGMAYQQRIAPRIGAYLDGATELLEHGLTSEERLTRARALGEQREAALGELRGYMEVLQKDSDAAVATMAGARERVASGSLAMVTLAALFALVAAGLTARSVRRPMRELTQAAASLGDGDWLAALRLATRELPAGDGPIAVRSETRILARALAAAAARLAHADDHKNRFLAVLAHELRNPMAPMTSGLEVLRRVPADSDEGRRALAIIDRQTRQIVRLTDDLLDVTRISQGKMRLERESMDLVQVARACVEDHTCMLADRSLSLEVDLPATPLWVHGDRARLAQVIGNLLANAAKFTDPGGVIRLRVHEDRPRAEAVLQVADTGIGMDAGLIPRLFEPFSQGPTGLARGNAGLGLGLALVKSLVSLHGGSVEARSAGAGCGSEFVIRLPLGVPAALSAAPDQRTAARDAADPSRWRVLVVDDYVDAAMGLRALIRLDGHRVEIATDGPEALEKARAFRPQLVLCDIGLPTMDGFEVARHLRAEAGGQDLLLVALTGYDSESDLARCAAAGFDRHFVKPLDPERLRELFGELARRSARQGPSGEAPWADGKAAADEY